MRLLWPTLLGVHPWNCYWEWVLGDVGPNAYMHRPLYWPTLELAPGTTGPGTKGPGTTGPGTTGPGTHELAPELPNAAPPAPRAPCRQIEWPGRFLARTALVAQRRAQVRSGGRYASHPAEMLHACASDPPSGATAIAGAAVSAAAAAAAAAAASTVSAACDHVSLAYALSLPSVFRLELWTRSNTSGGNGSATLHCPTSTDCFLATWHVTVPHGSPGAAGYTYTTSIDSNGRVDTNHSLPHGKRPCLP